MPYDWICHESNTTGSCLMTGFVTRVTRRVPLVEQELRTLEYEFIQWFVLLNL
jgi:hypothetical protein